MPIIWVAWLAGIPIKSRVAGSDILDALKTKHNAAHPLKIFLFGGPEGVAAAASQALNIQQRWALLCRMALSGILFSRGDESG